MDPLISQLADLCSRARTEAKWIIVPSYMVGIMMGEQLARSGNGWANLRWTTPDELARRVTGPSLVSRNVTLISDGAGPLVLMRVLLGLPVTIPAYFRGMAHHFPMAEALWHTISELRMTGLTGDALAMASWCGSPNKQAELTSLVQA
jgi:hypothetical protein